MARAGDVIENPRSGERITFEQTGAETNGECLTGKIYLARRGIGPPEHVHPQMEERFRVLAGTLTASVARKRRVVSPGQEFLVPPGTPHHWWNETDEEVVLEYRVSPALPLDRFLENVFAMVHMGHADANGVPRPLRMSRVLAQFWDVVYLAKPALPIQKALMTVLAVVARLLRYPAEYTYPYDRARA